MDIERQCKRKFFLQGFMLDRGCELSRNPLDALQGEIEVVCPHHSLYPAKAWREFAISVPPTIPTCMWHIALDSEALERKDIYQVLYVKHGYWHRPEQVLFDTIERDSKRMP